MAQRQLAQQPHHQVQGDGHDNVSGEGNQHIGHLAAGLVRIHEDAHDGIGDDHRGQREAVFVEGFTDTEHVHGYTFSLICLPSRPVGFTTRTSTSTPKTIASDHSVEI